MWNRITKFTDWKLYGVGAFLLLAGLCFHAGANISTDLRLEIFYGSFFGFLFWLFTAPFHFLLQFLARYLLRKLRVCRTSRDVLILNAPVFLFAGYGLLLFLYHPGEKERFFRQLVADPLPPSVSITGYAKSRGMGDESYLTLTFQINQSDLKNVLARGGFSLVQPRDDLDLSTYKEIIEEKTQFNAELDSSCSHFVVRSKEPVKHLFYCTNHARAYFWLCPKRLTSEF